MIVGFVCSFFWDVGSFSSINFDDPQYVFDNSYVLSGLQIDSIFWAFSTNTMGHWHPLTWLFHMLDVELFGASPGEHHLSNLFLFSLNAGLVFFLMRALGGRLAVSLVITAFWVLNPMRLESFVWIAEKKDQLSLFFGLLALISFVQFKSNTKRTILSSCFLFLSLLCKPTFVTLPAVLIFYLWFVESKKSFLSIARLLWPQVFLSAGLCLSVILTQKSVGALKDGGLAERILMASNSCLAYLSKFLFPIESSIFYPRTPIDFGVSLGGLMVLLALGFLIGRKVKSYPMLVFGFFFFLITALPVSGLIPIGGQAYADRWTLVPHLGFLIALLSIFERPRFYRGKWTMAVLWVVAFCVLSFVRLGDWQNSETIFKAALDQNEENFLAHNNLGVFYAERKRFEEADRHYKKVVELNPTYAPGLNNWGSSLARRKRWEEAEFYFKKALLYDPSLESARSNLMELNRMRKP